MSTEKIMLQAQVFASTWSVVGGPFDGGDAVDVAMQEKDELKRMVAELVEERDALAARLAELEGQEPVAWMNAKQDMASLINFHEDGLPLYARPVPAEMSPEFTDTARSALLWVLWHHQGGSSPVGQPIRYALGMDAHDRLSDYQVQEAKRWAELTNSETRDFHRRPAEQPVNARLLDVATGKTPHLYEGRCPDSVNGPESRDPDCPACQAITSADAAHADPVNVDFGKRGENMFFKIGNQSFLLDYKPAEPGEFEFMQKMLLSAFSSITPCVKTASEPVNARLLECISEAVSAYERYGGICTFEGEPMIYASTLIEIAEIAAEAQQAELVDERVIDRTWVRFCGAFGDGPDAPYPGMIAAFETHYGQSFRDKAWRTEAACWAAAWSKAAARAESALAEPKPDADGPWKTAVIEQLIIAHILTAEHESDPLKAIQDLLAYHADIAVDPRVSGAAATLVEQAKAEEREACAKVCESRQTPGTGSVAILRGAADAILARGQK